MSRPFHKNTYQLRETLGGRWAVVYMTGHKHKAMLNNVRYESSSLDRAADILKLFLRGAL